VAKTKLLEKIPESDMEIFKIENRKGYAAICRNNLTEGETIAQAQDRMNKALKRMGFRL